MTITEKKYQLISSILTIDKLDDLKLIEQLVFSIPKSNSSVKQMSHSEFEEMIDEGLQDHEAGRVFTSKELLHELRFKP